MYEGSNHLHSRHSVLAYQDHIEGGFRPTFKFLYAINRQKAQISVGGFWCSNTYSTGAGDADPTLTKEGPFS